MARKTSFLKGAPIETFNRNFYILAVTAIRGIYVASSILKDNQVLGNDMVKDLAQVEETILNSLSKNISDPQFLRSRFFVKAGKSPKDPFVVSTASKEASKMVLISRKGENYKNESPYNLDFSKTYKFSDLIDLSLKALEDRDIKLSDSLKMSIAPNGLKSYFDLMQINIKFEEVGNYSDTIHHKLIIDFEIAAKVYSKLIKSEDAEQNTYLLSIWLHNTFQTGANRGRQIVDPRLVANNTRRLSVEYGEPKPRVNKDGYALYKTGLPMFIGNGRIDYIDKLMKSGAESINEEGYFSPEAFSQKTNLINKVIYVDWYNDLLVYTSATGLIQTISLRGTSKLTEIDEFQFLSIPIYDPKLNIMNRVIQNMMLEVSFQDMKAEFLAMGEKESDLFAYASTFSNTFAFIVSNSGKEAAPVVSYAMIAGLEKNNIKADISARSTYSIAYQVGVGIRVMQAYFKAFKKLGKSPDSFQLPPSLQPLGIRAFLEGAFYIINTMAIKDTKDIEALRDLYEEERTKWSSDPNITSIKIPNVKVGGRGFNGLLPHQASVASSLVKNPSYTVLPIATGGGKSTLSYIAAASNILANPKARPLISTKGNLIHNTITEINTITGGQFNAIPFTPAVIRRLRTQAGLKGIKDLMKWVRDLPPNTILINSYSNFGSKSIIFEEMPQDEFFADIEIGMSQYNKIIRLCNITSIIGDESHLIKNVTSKRTRGAYGAMAAVEQRTIMSGTLISNTIKDIVGQVNAVTPNVFGSDVDKFCDDYNISQTGILSDADAELIKKKLTSSVAWHQATPDDWGYMLPDTDDKIVFTSLTPKQESYYNKVLKEALIEIEKAQANGGEDGEDGEDSEDSESEEDENSDDSFVARASKHLMPLEEFLVAPDFNEIFVNQKGPDKPSGDDLISPKVKAIDSLIAQHLEQTKSDPGNNKIIICGWSLNGIRHLQRHSKYKDEAVTYFAGDNDAIRQYKDDPTIRIMFAAETSIREGENLQMTSKIIRMQSVWAPGDHVQLRARMYRPDPRGIYKRDKVSHIWVLSNKVNGDPTLDGLKAARLSSKTVNNARLTYEGRPEWRTISKSFDDLSTFKMNIETLVMSRASDIFPYVESWHSYNKWEMGLNQLNRVKKARQLEASSGVDLIDENGKIKDISQFIKLAMVKVEPIMIPNSKKVYTPWVPRVLPSDPDDYWGWQTVGSSPLKEGEVVMTEYGPGIVEWVKDKNCKVICYGDRGFIFPRTMIVKPNPKKQTELNAIPKDPIKWHSQSLDITPLKAPSGKKNISTEKQVTPPTTVTGIKTPVPEKPITPVSKPKVEEENEKLDLDIIPTIINGFPAIICMENIEELKKLPGWNKIDPYIGVQFKTWNFLDKFLDQLHEKFYFDKKTLDSLENEIELLRSGKAMSQTKKINMNDLRNFLVDQKKKLGFKTLSSGAKEAIVKPYFLTVDRKVRLVFDIDSHDPSIIRFVRGLKGDSRVQSFVEVKKPIWMNVFKDISEARRDIANLSQIAVFDKAQVALDLADVARELKELSAPRRTPNA